MAAPLPPPAAADWGALARAMDGELLLDRASRERYARDESPCEVLPAAVARPHSVGGLRAALAFCAKRGIGVTLRAGGSSLAGQCVGAGLVVDVSDRFDRILEVDPARGVATVEPGVVLARLNDAAAVHGLRFGPDPSSFESARVGGVVGNNASGLHHLLWGATVDNIVSLDLLLSNGETMETRPVRVGSPEHEALSAGSTRAARIWREAPEVIARAQDAIGRHFPVCEKSSSGYRLDKALEAGVFDPGKLVCGSEGTLAIVTRATLRLVDIPKARGLTLFLFHSVEDAARGVALALKTSPSAVELVDDRVVRLVHERHPGRAPLFPPQAAAAAFVEHVGADLGEVEQKMLRTWQLLRQESRLAFADQATTDPGTMDQLWAIRRAVEPMLSEVRGARVPVGFVEDTAVPVERLAEHLRGMYRIFDARGLQAAAYGHASAGHLHVRPYLDLDDPADRALLPEVAREVFEHTRRLGGTMSGEHGDGLLRSEFLPGFFGLAYEAFRAIKELFDPEGVLNPGKKVGAPPGQLAASLRAPRAGQP